MSLIGGGSVTVAGGVDGTGRRGRWRAQRQVNTELLRLYWQIGTTIRTRQQAEGWGTRVIDRLAGDLRAAFPEMRGLSRSGAETGESRTARRSRRAGAVATWRPLRRWAGRVHGQTWQLLDQRPVVWRSRTPRRSSVQPQSSARCCWPASSTPTRRIKFASGLSAWACSPSSPAQNIC